MVRRVIGICIFELGGIFEIFQNVIGDAFRGATWVSIHNGGGVGWGDAINGGFGLLLDGSEVR